MHSSCRKCDERPNYLEEGRFPLVAKNVNVSMYPPLPKLGQPLVGIWLQLVIGLLLRTMAQRPPQSTPLIIKGTPYPLTYALSRTTSTFHTFLHPHPAR